ncbi:expressed unknown protein [Seminavis robusta]|uniref:Peroxidase n=1 Tax=Seminavis robusta TaxID=568900 RepID=A0A9N8HNI6_9STRA|nr:expressed unknown protein [Seminavis robusta]|eukprot:Sro1087_g239910.1 n/a (228) ;mRNA; f:36666-37349
MKLALSLISFLAVAVEGSGYSRMVLKYDHGVHLEDVAAAVDVAGVHVERQLACTRGLLISVDEQGLEALQDFGGITVVPEDDSHPVVRRLQGVNTPQGNGECDYAQTCANLRTVAELTVDNVNDIKNEIRSELENGDLSFDGSLGDNAGAVMRLLFHDAASFDKNDAANLSGLNGCVNRGNSGNAGLGNVQAWLVGLQEFLLSDYTINIVSNVDDTRVCVNAGWPSY